MKRAYWIELPDDLHTVTSVRIWFTRGYYGNIGDMTCKVTPCETIEQQPIDEIKPLPVSKKIVIGEEGICLVLDVLTGKINEIIRRMT